MNVLLAEANVPYEELVDLDDINPQFPQANVALVVGANDVTNPAARKPGTPVSGMPILDVDKAQNVVVMKRGRGTGYAGIQNELYFEDNTQMLFGDAKASLQACHRSGQGTHQLTDRPSPTRRSGPSSFWRKGLLLLRKLSTDRYGGVDRWKLSTYSLFSKDCDGEVDGYATVGASLRRRSCI